jgi:hypothetical protein
MIDCIGSSGTRAFRADDFGQLSHQGNSKAHNSSPGRHWPDWPVACFIRQVKGIVGDCWSGMATLAVYRRELQTSLSPIDAEGRAVIRSLGHATRQIASCRAIPRPAHERSDAGGPRCSSKTACISRGVHRWVHGLVERAGQVDSAAALNTLNSASDQGAIACVFCGRAPTRGVRTSSRLRAKLFGVHKPSTYSARIKPTSGLERLQQRIRPSLHGFRLLRNALGLHVILLRGRGKLL